MEQSTLTPKTMHSSKRGQVWSFDLLVAIVIFVAGLFVIYFFALNNQSSAFDDTTELYYEADLASNVLLSEDEESIVTNGKINQTKLDSFDALSDSLKKSRLGVSNNFYIMIPGMTINGSPKEKVGIVNTTDVENLVLLTRIVLYQDRVTTMEVFSWS